MGEFPSDRAHDCYGRVVGVLTLGTPTFRLCEMHGREVTRDRLARLGLSADLDRSGAPRASSGA